MKIYLPTPERLCHCNAASIDPEALATLEEGFLRLRLADAVTPLKKHLPRRVFALLQFRTSPMGASLLDVAQSGMLHHDAPVGAVLPDPTAYEPFRVLLDPLLDERHLGFDADDCQPDVSWGDWSRLRSLDPRRKYVLSTAVSACRNLPGFRFTPTIVPAELQKVEDTVLLTLYKLPGEYAGKYEFIKCMPPSRKKELERDHCLFTCGDKHDHAANVPRFWSYGRGVFVNEEHTFFVWINSRDHMRVVSQEMSGDLPKAYHRLVEVMPVLDACLRPVRHERLGFLTVSLDNIGSGLILSARMKLPHLPQNVLESIAKVYHMETQHLEDDMYVVSSRSHLGYTEFEVVREFNHGIREVLCMARFYNKRKRKGKHEDSFPPDNQPPGDGQGDKRRKPGRKNGSEKETGEDRTITETTTETVTEVITVETSESGGRGGSPVPANLVQDFIWARPSVLVMRASVSTTASRPSLHRSLPGDARDRPFDHDALLAVTDLDSHAPPAHKETPRPKIGFYDDTHESTDKQYASRKAKRSEKQTPIERRASESLYKVFPPHEPSQNVDSGGTSSQVQGEHDGPDVPRSRPLNNGEMQIKPMTEAASQSRTPGRSHESAEDDFYRGGFLPEEQSTKRYTEIETRTHSTDTKFSTYSDTGGILPEEKTRVRKRASITARHPSTPERVSDTADLFSTGGFLPEKKSPSTNKSKTHEHREPQEKSESEAADLFYTGGILPEERTTVRKTASVTAPQPSTSERVSDTADLFYTGGFLPEEKSPSTNKSKTHEHRKPQEKSESEAHESTASQNNYAIDLFYTSGVLPEEKWKTIHSAQTSTNRDVSVNQFSSSSDMFQGVRHRTGEKSQIQTMSSTGDEQSSGHIDSEESESDDLFNLGVLPEEKRKAESDKSTASVGLNPVGRNVSKENTLSSLRKTRIHQPHEPSASKDSYAANLFYTGGILSEEKSKPVSSSLNIFKRDLPLERFTSAADLFYKGETLPEKLSLSRKSANKIHKSAERTVSEQSDDTDLFYLRGFLSEKKTKIVETGKTSSSSTGGILQMKEHASLEDSLITLRGSMKDQGRPESNEPKKNYATDLFVTGGLLPEQKSKNACPDQASSKGERSVERFSSAADMFYKEGPIVEEISIFRYKSATNVEESSEAPISGKSDNPELVCKGVSEPEMNLKLVQLDRTILERPTSVERFSSASDMFYKGGPLPEEINIFRRNSSTQVRQPSEPLLAGERDITRLVHKEGIVPEQKSKPIPSVERFSSASDMFYNGGLLPEEIHLPHRKSGSIDHQPTVSSESEEGKTVELFYRGVLPEDYPKTNHSGNKMPQRRSSAGRLMPELLSSGGPLLDKTSGSRRKSSETKTNDIQISPPCSSKPDSSSRHLTMRNDLVEEKDMSPSQELVRFSLTSGEVNENDNIEREKMFEPSTSAEFQTGTVAFPPLRQEIEVSQADVSSPLLPREEVNEHEEKEEESLEKRTPR